jgi:UDP-N-acetylmuramyl tripeptide synthase
MRKFIAIRIAKTARWFSRATKQGDGSTLPGLIAEKIDPRLVSKLAAQLPEGIILITGTNGKTTVSKMLAAILTEAGRKVIYNFSGSNLSRGISSILIQHSNFWGTKINGDIAILEVDEATIPEICSKLSPKIILVTNLFRDQLDRYGEIDKTAQIIGSGLEASPDAIVFLNVDDPLVASFSQYNPQVVYFGIDTDIATRSSGAIDTKNCLPSGHELIFDVRYYGHLGKYRCSKCDFKRPVPHYLLKELNLLPEESKAIFTGPNTNININIFLPGLYNLYNALAAASIAGHLDISGEIIQSALSKVSAAFGRMEKIPIGDKNLFLLLIKNPIGFTQAIETLTYDKKPKNLFIALNDYYADGTDISWIWDAEPELIKDLAKSVMVSGVRAEDMLLRIKYADFDMKNVAMNKNIEKALLSEMNKLSAGETLYILPTYTAMLEIRKILTNKGFIKGVVE